MLFHVYYIPNPRIDATGLRKNYYIICETCHIVVPDASRVEALANVAAVTKRTF